MDPTSVADELYGLDPDDFTAARDERAGEARRAGNRETAAAIQQMRRPSGAAWAVNVLARHRPDEVRALAELGLALGEAQHRLAADELRALGRKRHGVVAGLVREARALARERGHPLSDAAAREVGATLEAALADPVAAEAVRAGQLVRSLQPGGFGVLSPDGGLIPSGRGPAATSPQDSSDEARRGSEAARLELEQARRDAAAAEQAAGHAARAAEEAQRASAAADEAVGRLEADLEEARKAATAAAAKARTAIEERRRAEQEAIDARRRVEEAAVPADEATRG